MGNATNDVACCSQFVSMKTYYTLHSLSSSFFHPHPNGKFKIWSEEFRASFSRVSPSCS